MQHTYTAKISASKVGAIGALGTEKRTYTFKAAASHAVQDAIRLAYAEDLEHVTVTSLVKHEA